MNICRASAHHCAPQCLQNYKRQWRRLKRSSRKRGNTIAIPKRRYNEARRRSSAPRSRMHCQNRTTFCLSCTLSQSSISTLAFQGKPHSQDTRVSPLVVFIPLASSFTFQSLHLFLTYTLEGTFVLVPLKEIKSIRVAQFDTCTSAVQRGQFYSPGTCR